MMHFFLRPDPDYTLGSLQNPYPSDKGPEDLRYLYNQDALLLHGTVPGISRSNYECPTSLPAPALLSQQAPELVAHTRPAARHVHFSNDVVKDANNDGHNRRGASRSHNIDRAPQRHRTSRPAYRSDCMSLLPSRELDLATRSAPLLPISQEQYPANTARLIRHQHHIRQDDAAPSQRQTDIFHRNHTHDASSSYQNLGLHEEETGERWPDCQECELKPSVYKYHGMQYCKACFGDLCARAINFEKHKRLQVQGRGAKLEQ